MDQRRSPRILPGPDSMIELRSTESGTAFRGPLLDQSVDGIAIQLGRTCQLAPGDTVVVQVGSRWEEATVVSTTSKGLTTRVGLHWMEQYQEPALDAVLAARQP